MINRRITRRLSAVVAGLALSCAADAQPGEHIREIGTPSIQTNTTGGTTSLDFQRGALLYFDSFDRYPKSTDPIFDRFQVSLQGEANGTGGQWTAFNNEFLASLFVDGQVDQLGAPDPLPRWMGADLVESNGESIPGDLSGDFVVDTTDLGVLIGSFGQTGPNRPADLNNDGIVDTADLGIMIGVFGQTLGPFCLYQVTLVHEVIPGGAILPQPVLDASPALGEIIAVPTSQGVCGGCPGYRILSIFQTQEAYGDWKLLDAQAPTVNLADFIANSTSQACNVWGDQSVLALARTESDVNIPNCCFFSLFSPMGRQSTASPLSDIVTDVDVYLTGHQTFLWLQGFDNNLRTSWDVMLGGIALWVDPNLLPFADADGELNGFTVRQTQEVAGVAGGLFFGTVPDAISGATGKQSMLGEWFTLRMVQHANSTFELWVRDSQTTLLENTAPGSDSDGVSDDGYARLVPGGPYGPAISNLQPGVAAPDPFLVESPSLRQLQWLWGGDPSPAEDPDYVPANWFMDNIRISGPF